MGRIYKITSRVHKIYWGSNGKFENTYDLWVT